MSVVPFRRPPTRAKPVPMAGPWLDGPDTLGPCRRMGGETVAMVYPNVDGRWSWMVRSLGRVVAASSTGENPGEAQRQADALLESHGMALA